MKSVIERIEEKTHYLPECGCWVFAGLWQHAGHGSVRVGGPNERVHRVSWEHFNGPIPDGMVVRHKCDTPACWNPAHLLLGTQTDNVRDRNERGRTARGKCNGRTKITEEIARHIIEMTGKVSGRELARRYGLAHTSVQLIQKRKNWGWINGV